MLSQSQGYGVTRSAQVLILDDNLDHPVIVAIGKAQPRPLCKACAISSACDFFRFVCDPGWVRNVIVRVLRVGPVLHINLG